ncbi:MAG: hypothetical protein LC110_08515 [Burkholderiales bacterium]|nr:plasmid mobilization relaxosome protein MobC [Candidatus Hydrogenedentota bacterium]MCZ2174562.1 hypothetical protein [Burkholderiales bacterium]
MNTDELNQLRERARGARLPLSILVRNAALGLEIVPAAPTAPEINIEKYSELARLAGNLNQVTHHLNAGHIVATEREKLDLLDTLSMILTNVQHLRRDLLGAGK